MGRGTRIFWRSLRNFFDDQQGALVPIGQGIGLGLLQAAAQQLDGFGGGIGFGLGIGPLQGQEGAPLLHQRQAVFAQFVQLGHGTGGGTVKLLTLGALAGIFGPGVQPCGLQSQLLQQGLQKDEALVQAVQ